MSGTGGGRLAVVLYEGAGSAVLDDEERLGLLTFLLDGGYDVRRVSSGGAMAADGTSPTLVLGRFDGGQPADGDHAAVNGRLRFQDISRMDSAGVLGVVQKLGDELGVARPGAWVPWFPVIDQSRCENCKQCLSFCLFDVFGLDEERHVEVLNHANCKTNCPACARVCPEAAIMFPKYDGPPINGDEVREEDIGRETTRVDVSALLAGDAQLSLRKRGTEARRRFSTTQAERTEAERVGRPCKCKRTLTELGIPKEVLSELCPGPESTGPGGRAGSSLHEHQKEPRGAGGSSEAPSEEEWGI
jgi:Pyruvate/2-oxoacid:ferredoxin oxidoreductase delta subunit